MIVISYLKPFNCLEKRTTSTLDNPVRVFVPQNQPTNQPTNEELLADVFIFDVFFKCYIAIGFNNHFNWQNFGNMMHNSVALDAFVEVLKVTKKNGL